MFKRYRNIGFAIGLIIASLSGSVHGANPNDSPNGNSGHNTTREPSPAPSGVDASTYQYPYSCKKPKDAEQDNLCIARKSAQAAVDAAFWTRATAWVGIAGTVAVVITLVVSVASTFIALDSAKLARESLVFTQRPYIYADDLKAFWEIDPKTKKYYWRFRPIWNNAGNSSTNGLRMHTECVVLGAPLPNGFNFDYVTDPITTANGIIHRNMSTLGCLAPNAPKTPISPENILDAQKGRALIYLIGWARYFDGISGKREYITRFCWHIIPVGDPIKNPKKLRWDRIYHHEGNCADNSCKR